MSCWQFLSIWWGLQLHLSITGHSAITCSTTGSFSPPHTHTNPPFPLNSTTAHMADRNRIVFMSVWIAAQLRTMLRRLTDSGMWAFSPQEKPLRPFRLWAVLLQQALVLVGPAELQDWRQSETETQLEWVKDRNRRFALKRTRTASCSHEPSWEHLTFQSLTKRMGKFSSQIRLNSTSWECGKDAVRNFS